MVHSEVASNNRSLGRELIRDELFDLTLYKKYRTMKCGHLAELLDQLIPVEEHHLTHWEQFFGMQVRTLNFRRRVRLWVLMLAGRIFGEPVMHIVLDAIEIYGIRKYLAVWDQYRDTELGTAVRSILQDEMQHEEAIVSRGVEQRIRPARIREIFLGFNDGLVEMLGAVSGFTAAFADVSSVLIAGLTVAVAGALSMAAGVLVSTGSEIEIENTEIRKKQFLGLRHRALGAENPFGSAMVVGVSYILGSMVPLLPVRLLPFGILGSVVLSAIFIVFVSYVLAFLTGMNIRKRIVTNLVLISLAVLVSYTIGLAARSLFGITV